MGSTEEKKNSFKVIFSVENAPWLIKRAVPKRPFRVGNKMRMDTHFEPNDHLEIVIDASLGRAERMATNLVMGAVQNLQLAMTTLIEAKHEDELPEALLLSAGMTNVNVPKFSCLDDTLK